MSPLLGRLGLRARWVATIAVIAWFALLTRFEPSVLAGRARWPGWPPPRRSWPARCRPCGCSALAVTGLLLVDPLLVWSVGWWLSVGATAGIAAAGGADRGPAARPSPAGPRHRGHGGRPARGRARCSWPCSGRCRSRRCRPTSWPGRSPALSWCGGCPPVSWPVGPGRAARRCSTCPPSSVFGGSLSWPGSARRHRSASSVGRCALGLLGLAALVVRRGRTGERSPPT